MGKLWNFSLLSREKVRRQTTNEKYRKREVPPRRDGGEWAEVTGQPTNQVSKKTDIWWETGVGTCLPDAKGKCCLISLRNTHLIFSELLKTKYGLIKRHGASGSCKHKGNSYPLTSSSPQTWQSSDQEGMGSKGGSSYCRKETLPGSSSSIFQNKVLEVLSKGNKTTKYHCSWKGKAEKKALSI